MKTKPFLHVGRLPAFSAIAVWFAVVSPTVHAQQKKTNPSSKVYISDVSGQAQINTGDRIQDLAKRSVYNAEGTTIEIKKTEKPSDDEKNYSTMVYSNGTGAYVDRNTKIEVKRFVQEPFTPNRTDMDVEPSISQTRAFIARGTIGLCTSKLVAGSTMAYPTPHGAVNIRGRKIVIQATDQETKISMLEGDSTVRAGDVDLGGHTLRAGEQAIIRSGGAGRPNSVEVTRIPPSELAGLDDKVAQACIAKKTVYFEVKETKVLLAAGEAVPANAVADAAGAPAGAGADAPAAVTAFDAPSANTNAVTSSPKSVTVTVREIVPVEVVPTTLPVEFAISPSTLVKPKAGSGG